MTSLWVVTICTIFFWGILNILFIIWGWLWNKARKTTPPNS